MFVASRSAVLAVGAAVPLPTANDLGGNAPSFTLYSHMRVPGGATYTFSNGVAHVVPATTDTVIAIPVEATTVTASAASTAQFGQAF